MRGSRRGPAKRFEDILANIILIEEFTAGMDLAAFAQDPKTSNASERCMERISEAAKKLGDAAESLCPEIEWPQLRAVGNFLRYEYDRIEVSRVWLMIEDDLPPLKTTVQAALERLQGKKD